MEDMEPSILDSLKKLALVLSVSLSGISPSVAVVPSLEWPNPIDIPNFITEMKDKHGFDEEALKTLFHPLKPNSFVLKAIAPPTDPGFKSWQRYRARFLDTARVENGVRFWAKHKDTLARAEESFGVPPEVIVAIIGVETEYGKNKGHISVLDALTTIAFAYPPRREFFRAELEQFLLMARENRQAPEAIKGSYAGAIGIPQFMPSSQRRFAVDFDADGRVDLMNSSEDAIGSVARFLKLHGWQANQAATEPVRGPLADAQTLVNAGIKPSLGVTELKAGAIKEEHLPAQFPVTLIDLVTPDASTEYWWGFDNFYAITRYNRSSFYAMSVVQLGQAIKQRRDDNRPLKSVDKKPAKSGYRVKRHRAE